MQTLKKILCPVDFSETSLTAARHAAELARAAGATLVLVHAMDQGSYFVEASGHSYRLMWEDYERAVRERLASLADRLDAGSAIESHVLVGRPQDVISRETEETQPDLVVMGTHGRSALGKLLLGSVAERVVSTSRVPVLTVRAA
jgi:universal stress protein A